MLWDFWDNHPSISHLLTLLISVIFLLLSSCSPQLWIQPLPHEICWQFTLLIIQVCFFFLPFFSLFFHLRHSSSLPLIHYSHDSWPWLVSPCFPTSDSQHSSIIILSIHVSLCPSFDSFIFLIEESEAHAYPTTLQSQGEEGVPSWKRQERNFWKLLWSLVVLSSITPWQDEERRNTPIEQSRGPTILVPIYY